MPLGSAVTNLARARLRTQLMLTYVLVLVIDVIAFALTMAYFSVLGGGSPPLIPTAEAMRQYSDHLDSGLVRGLVAGAALSLITGAFAAILITRLIVRPVDHLRTAARDMTGGHYDARVPMPSTPELAVSPAT